MTASRRLWQTTIILWLAYLVLFMLGGCGLAQKRAALENEREDCVAAAGNPSATLEQREAAEKRVKEIDEELAELDKKMDQADAASSLLIALSVLFGVPLVGAAAAKGIDLFVKGKAV